MWDDARSNLDFHVQGAQAMIKLRASTQKHSRLGQAMFEFICSFIVSAHIFCGGGGKITS